MALARTTLGPPVWHLIGWLFLRSSVLASASVLPSVLGTAPAIDPKATQTERVR